MRIVIDSNRVVASLLKDSTTRAILFNETFEFLAPEYVREDVVAHSAELMKKLKVRAKEFDALVAMVFDHITLVRSAEYNPLMRKLHHEISDIKDIPFLACCITTHSVGIWSHDPHMREQKRVKVLTNIDMLQQNKTA